jgi:hypothetical protein
MFKLLIILMLALFAAGTVTAFEPYPWLQPPEELPLPPECKYTPPVHDFGFVPTLNNTTIVYIYVVI